MGTQMTPMEFRTNLRRYLDDDTPHTRAETTLLMIAYSEASVAKQTEVSRELRRDLNQEREG